MKSEIFHKSYPNGDVNIEYIFLRAPNSSDALVVSFPGAGGDIAGGEWGYIVTLNKFNVNTLFIKSKNEQNKSRLTYKDGEPIFEDAIKELVNRCYIECGASRIIAIGSSMGGFCSLYYGLKYDWDIISGAPPYSFKDRSQAMFALGGDGEKELKLLNEKVYSVVRDAGKRGFNKKIFISWGEGESNWKGSLQGQKLIRDLEAAGIEYTYKLYPYSSHHSVHKLFPGVLKIYLGYFLGLSKKPNDDEKLVLSPEAELTLDLKQSCSDLSKYIQEFNLIDSQPSYDIKMCKHYGDNEPSVGLRNYAYIEQGWYWSSGSKQPIKFSDKNSFWRNLPVSKIGEGLCFWFQDTLLNYYEHCGDKSVLMWCTDNAYQYLEYVSSLADPKNKSNWWNSLRRMHYFLALAKNMQSIEYIPHWFNLIHQEILQDVSNFINTELLAKDAEAQYRRTLGLLHMAAYMRMNQQFFEKLYEVILKLLNMLTNYYFDDNGVCVLLQLKGHCILARRLMENITFIESNDFPENRQLRSLKKKYEKILVVCSHATRPDGILSSLGHSASEKNIWTYDFVSREKSNLILNSSNIAFLEDSTSLSYITVCGGSNVRSNYRHCDLLSFTWFYDNRQLFVDAGGGTGDLSEYSLSSLAHNTLVVDDKNYVTPDHDDWTCIEHSEEQDSYVSLTMVHSMYEGVVLKRNLIWIKPNIIIVCDDCTSDTKHKYTQNFMLDDFAFNNKDKSKLLIDVSSNYKVSITQFKADNLDFSLEIHNGTFDLNDEKNYRGSLVSGFKKLQKGLNVSYIKNSTNAKFMTVIEVHGASSGLSEKEKSMSDIKCDDLNITVTLSDGTFISVPCVN